jgi:DNA (cytosine-5)-methyltransferase 1
MSLPTLRAAEGPGAGRLAGAAALRVAAAAAPRVVDADAPRVAEFFAGIGLVREALQPLGLQVVWANDIEPAKRRTYAANHDAAHFLLGDVRDLRGADLPAGLDLATSSFPCVDLSLAGRRRGLAGEQSGMFHEFARILAELTCPDRPRMVLLENVHGFATSRGGADLRYALQTLNALGYSCDVLAIDARHFVAQSRPRLFVVGVAAPLVAGPDMRAAGAPDVGPPRPSFVQRVYLDNADLTLHHRDLPPLPDGPADLAGVVQTLRADDARWWTDDQVAAFRASLSPTQAMRLSALMARGELTWRTAYRRTRGGVAVWEMRRDGIAGCLRTTGGGSSKQALVEIRRGRTRVRWLTPLEYARLMGAGRYRLTGSTDNQARFGFGDAVVVDVVRWIGENYLLPVLRSR